MKVTNTASRIVCVTDKKNETYHVPAKARNVDLPTIVDVLELPKELVKISD